MPIIKHTPKDQAVMGFLLSVYEAKFGQSIPGFGLIGDCTPISYKVVHIDDFMGPRVEAEVTVTNNKSREKTLYLTLDQTQLEEFNRILMVGGTWTLADPPFTTTTVPGSMAEDWARLVKKDKLMGAPESTGVISPRTIPEKVFKQSVVSITNVCSLRPETKARAIALKCECGRFNCVHIAETYQQNRDASYWISFVTGPLAKSGNKSSHVQLAIPVFNYVLQRVEIECAEFERWDGTNEMRFMVSSFPWDARDRQMVYPVESSPIAQSIMRDQINVLQGSIFNTDIGKSLMTEASMLASGATQRIRCSFQNQMGPNGHSFGTNKKLIDWLMNGENEVGNLREIRAPVRQAALAFTIATYGMCYICYRNREPAFSTLPDF